jgi:hypothetical protein
MANERVLANGLICLCNNGGFAWKEDDGVPHTAKQAADDPGRRFEAFHRDAGTLRRPFFALRRPSAVSSQLPARSRIIEPVLDEHALDPEDIEPPVVL